jgi:hypothetical protein
MEIMMDSIEMVSNEEQTVDGNKEVSFNFDEVLSKLVEERDKLRKYVHGEVAEEIRREVWGE